MDQRGLVIHGSVYGTTRQYAQAIAGRFDLPCRPAAEVGQQELDGCRLLIFGGGLYAGGVAGLRRLLRMLRRPEEKDIVLFTVGIADPAVPENAAHIRRSLERQVPAGILERARVFHLRGGIDYGVLGPVHRAMMAMLCRQLRKKDPAQRSSEDQAVLDTYGKAISFFSLDSLGPLEEAVSALLAR